MVMSMVVTAIMTMRTMTTTMTMMTKALLSLFSLPRMTLLVTRSRRRLQKFAQFFEPRLHLFPGRIRSKA